MKGCALPPMSSKFRIQASTKAWQCQWRMKKIRRNTAIAVGIVPRSEDYSSPTACYKRSKKICSCARVSHSKAHRLWRLSRNWIKEARFQSSPLQTVWWTTLRRPKYSVSCSSCRIKRPMQQRRTGLLMSHDCLSGPSRTIRPVKICKLRS